MGLRSDDLALMNNEYNEYSMHIKGQYCALRFLNQEISFVSARYQNEIFFSICQHTSSDFSSVNSPNCKLCLLLYFLKESKLEII